MTLMTKPGVRVNGAQPEMQLALVAVAHATLKSSANWWITSWRDGKHSNQSLHYVGFAFDIDTDKPGAPMDIDLVENDIKAMLTDEFDLVREERDGRFSHFHIEFQPKLSEGDRISA